MAPDGFFPTPYPAPVTKPLHPWSVELEQHRVKLQTFSNCPPEVTIQRISFERDHDAYLRAYNNGFSRVSSGRRVRDPDRTPDPEDVERAKRRAKTRVRLLTQELAPDHFVTFTTREVGPSYLSPDDWAVMWAHCVRLIRSTGAEFEYVAVLERHPSNPQHLHLHVAWRGRIRYSLLHRFWRMAICARMGVPFTPEMLKGDKSPGTFRDEPIKAPRGSYKAVRKIARYIAKYLTKESLAEYNKKRYWPSKGIALEGAKIYYLNSLNQVDAIREACQLVGEWDYDLAVPGQKLFCPSERVVWFAVDPERTPPPF